jgi:Flp pilus assembly protein TadG
VSPRRRWRLRRRDETGAVAILVAALSLLILMFAAYAVDIGLQVNRKHLLIETLDSAAQAGAFELPDTATARTQALAFAQVHDPTETGTLAPNVDFWCIVAATGTTAPYAVDLSQIPSTCNPGTGPYTPALNYKTTGRTISCSAIICAIPCVEPVPNTATPKITCNTIRVYQGRDVPFRFAPAGGIAKGSTGSQISVACKGSCGTIAPNPMDVAVIADRTSSMNLSDVDAMVSGIKGMLQQMTPSQQYVSLGTIGRSDPATSSQSGSCVDGQLTWPSTSVTSGQFLPVSFSDNYVDTSGVLQTGSAIVKGLNCIADNDGDGVDEGRSPPETGTSLAAPMKAAARYLLGTDANNLSSLAAREDPVTKVIIFETDGQPNERIGYTSANQFNRFTGSTALGVAGEPFAGQMSLDPNGVTSTRPDDATPAPVVSGTTVTTTITHNKWVTYTYNGGNKACQNLLDTAANAKAQNILVIMIAYNMTGKRCNDYDGFDTGYTDKGNNYSASSSIAAGPEATTTTYSGGNTYVTKYQTRTTIKWDRADSATSPSVLNVMAQAASPINGVPSSNSNNCDTAADLVAENGDGDYFFCAASGSDMAPIFKTALSQVSKGIKLVRIP